MYDFRDEAILALTPKRDKPETESTTPKSWTLKHLAVSRSASVMHVHFKGAQTFGEKAASGLRDDFAQLADGLSKDSKVVLDFAGLKSFDSASIDALLLFKKKLQTKGSRIALCCLDPAARATFFAAGSP
jgi:MFS superfamily sulfate permease-like transporter